MTPFGLPVVPDETRWSIEQNKVMKQLLVIIHQFGKFT